MANFIKIQEKFMLTDNLTAIFDELREEYGMDALSKVESMLVSPNNHRKLTQAKAKYVLPGISSEPWRNIEDYPEIENAAQKLEALYPVIRKEIDKLKPNIDLLTSYDHYQVTMNDWKAIYLYKDEKPHTESFNLVPITAKFMQEDLKNLLCPFGEMHYSILKPGVHVPPHCDLWNFTLNLHFAIDIPENCLIRVVNETREWENGKCLLFDYSHEHEAWNNSKKTRICLLMDVWNPEITLPERKAITALISEIRSFL